MDIQTPVVTCSEFEFCKTFRFHTYHIRTLMLESVWVSITGTVSRLFAGWLGNCCSLSGRARDFSLVQSNRTSCGTHSTSESVGNPTSRKGWAVKLVTRLHLMPRLGMCGAILPLPHILRGKFC